MVETENVGTCLICNSKSSKRIESTSTMMGEQSEQWHFRCCENCQMVFLSPRVSADELGHYYTESYLPYRGSNAWGKYAHLVEGDQKKIDHKRLKTIEKYITPNSKSVLDIGCGKPSFLKLVQENTNLKVSGLDFSDKGWKSESELYQDIDLHISSIEQLPSNLKADIITMWHYLEHDYYPKKTLKSLSNQQEKGTLLVIEVPNHDSYSRRKHGKFWSGYHSPRHTGLYTPDTMKKLLETSGWEIVDQYSDGTLDPYTLDWMSRMEMKSIDWSLSMEPYFIYYVLGKLLRPRYYFHKSQSLGFMTAVARNVK